MNQYLKSIITVAAILVVGLALWVPLHNWGHRQQEAARHQVIRPVAIITTVKPAPKGAVKPAQEPPKVAKEPAEKQGVGADYESIGWGFIHRVVTFAVIVVCGWLVFEGVRYLAKHRPGKRETNGGETLHRQAPAPAPPAARTNAPPEARISPTWEPQAVRISLGVLTLREVTKWVGDESARVVDQKDTHAEFQQIGSGVIQLDPRIEHSYEVAVINPNPETSPLYDRPTRITAELQSEWEPILGSFQVSFFGASDPNDPSETARLPDEQLQSLLAGGLEIPASIIPYAEGGSPGVLIFSFGFRAAPTPPLAPVPAPVPPVPAPPVPTPAPIPPPPTPTPSPSRRARRRVIGQLVLGWMVIALVAISLFGWQRALIMTAVGTVLGLLIIKLLPRRPRGRRP